MDMQQPTPDHKPARLTGPVILDLAHISLSFGGVKA
jgi:hypothetical protein